ncbi:hypothetical protein [Streptomyces sp. NPDC057682]|uniref:hypothetical protein n=1 Tax=unclassified Streptomyces TaxID=2593676 RepID=UPI00365F6AF2
MGGTSDGLTASQLRVYLSIGASIVALLTFFGIRNFDDLREAVGHGPAGDSGFSDACHAAYEAEHSQENDSRAAPPTGASGQTEAMARAYRTYALRLRQAADLTSDATLRTDLVNGADDAQHTGDWWESPDHSMENLPAGSRVFEPWETDCLRRGIHKPL